VSAEGLAQNSPIEKFDRPIVTFARAFLSASTLPPERAVILDACRATKNRPRRRCAAGSIF
jgi:hypothetical protein